MASPMWQSNEPIDESAIVLKFFQRYVPDVSREDLKFLLNCIKESHSAHKGLQNVILKLKLEFGEDLARHNAAIEAIRKKAKAEAEAYERQREIEYRRNEKELAAAQRRKQEFADSVVALQALMDQQAIYSENDVPVELKPVYSQCRNGNAIKRMLGIGRPYIVASLVRNPHSDLVRHLSRRGSMHMDM